MLNLIRSKAAIIPVVLLCTVAPSCNTIQTLKQPATLEQRYFAMKRDYLEVVKLMVQYAQSDLADVEVVQAMLRITSMAERVMKVADAAVIGKPENQIQAELREEAIVAAINQLRSLGEELRLLIGYGIIYEGTPLGGTPDPKWSN